MYRKDVASDGDEVAAAMPVLIETEEDKTILNNFDTLKDLADSLDFEARPRKARFGDETIPLNDRKLPTAKLKRHIIHFCGRVMKEMGLESGMKSEVEDLVAKILFYDFGYKSVKASNMRLWENRLDDAFLNGLGEDDEPLQGKYKGKTALIDVIEEKHPNMVHKLFRRAQELLTMQASFSELAVAMTEDAATDEMGNHDWKFSYGIVRRWFIKKKGRFTSPKPKPYLTDDQKKERKKWCAMQKKKLESVEEALTAEAIAAATAAEQSDEEGNESEVEEEESYGTANLNQSDICCAAGSHCCMLGAPPPPTDTCRTCFNCREDMHDICGVEWEELLSSDYEVRETSLDEDGQHSLLAGEHETNSICLKCCKKVTDEEYKRDGRDFYAVFLDEKWFYTQSNRRKNKEMDPLPGEEPLAKSKAISRRNACKVMFIGAVANPVPERNFDGKIYLERISKTQKYKRMTCNQNFTYNAPKNVLLKEGDWIKHVKEDMTLLGLRSALQEEYDLDDCIKERLVIHYHIPGRDGKDKSVYIDDEAGTVPSCNRLELGGYTLKVQYKAGDTREVDISCDSKFMLEVMHKVGKAIRDAYYWVSLYWPIFLYLDNAGGHGTKEAVRTYVTFLRTEYNVICVHQRPRSPETNMLDLGVWMALQSVVEKMHVRRRYHADALAATVYAAFDALEPVKLSGVYGRWVQVLDLIIDDNGGNDKVESRRGLTSAPTSEVEGNEQVLAIANSGTADGIVTDDEEEIDIHEEEIDNENDDHSGCCAGRHCLMPGREVPSIHKCFNCGLDVHAICGVEWPSLSSKGYEIHKSSLTKEGQKYLDENHNFQDICFRCIERLTETN